MIPRPFHASLLLLTMCMSPAFSGGACASLGADAASVASDAARLHGGDQVTALQAYDLHEISADAGMRIREFVDCDGVVFAVAWSGPVVPDLHMLLGASYSTYTAALAAVTQRPLHRFVRIASPGLIVESGGHMRALSGRAYLPDLVPPGLSAADIH
ncbi:MAG: DUF2844 domain-containing protein [Steroidobacterales bacterium]